MGKCLLIGWWYSIDGFNKNKICKAKKEMMQSDNYNYKFYKSDSKEEAQWSTDSSKAKRTEKY